MGYFEKYEASQALVNDINDVLSRHGISERISLIDLTITEKTVSDLVKPVAKLSDAITNHLWPSTGSATVYHYTSREAAESILNSNEFWLFSLLKRCSEGEVVTFCKTHHLDGYLVNDENGEPVYKSLLMPNTFYASFTEINLPKNREEYFWQNFAQCDGVRLTVKIEASNPNLRKIKYEQKCEQPVALLTELSTLVQNKYKRSFILKGISRLCSFYLSGKNYGIENELRLLYRSWDGFGPQPVMAQPYPYIKVPLGSMNESGYKLDVIEVQAIERPSIPTSYKFTKRGT